MATEYKFVKEPPEEYCCMICAKVLNEPNLTDCCGQHFCRVCLEQWFEKNERKICPHCRSTSFSYMRYLPLKRKISFFQVYCTYQEQGCDVISTVGELDAHKGVCSFASLVCSQGCGETVLRKEMPRHCKEECLKRKVQCQHCGKMDYFLVISGKHMKTCEEYPMRCPKGCALQNLIKRKDLASHAKVCPLEQVHCTFRDVGCNEVVARKDLNSHLESNLQVHLMKIMTSYSEMRTSYSKLKSEHDKLKEECRKLASQVETLTLAEPVKLTDENDTFSFTLTLSEGWISPPFYVLGGYKFCIKHKTGAIASLLLLKGEFDDKLEWPIDLNYKLEVTSHGGERAALSTISDLIFPLSVPNLFVGGVSRVEALESSKELVQFTVQSYASKRLLNRSVTVKLVQNMLSPNAKLPAAGGVKEGYCKHCFLKIPRSRVAYNYICPYCGLGQ